MSQKIYRRLNILLILGSVLAAVKIIFVDYTMDEEYQLVMAYRCLSGDTLFGTMWEPHQTSAFACIWLMQLYRAVTGGLTGVVLFIRFVTLGIQLGLSIWLTRVLRKFLKRDYAFLLGCCYFNFVPKLIQIPEFSNLQLWFFTIMGLSLFQYYLPDFGVESQKTLRKAWLLPAGVSMALEVLSYPSCILLFPFFLAVIVFCSGKRNASDGKWSVRPALEDGILFSGICALCAVIWLFVILSKISPEEFFRNLNYILNFDLTHDLSLGSQARTSVWLRDGKLMLLHFGICTGTGGAIWGLANCILRHSRTKQPPRFSVPVFAVFLVLGAELVQLYYWIICRSGYDEPEIHLLMLYLAAALAWHCADRRKTLLFPGITGGVLTILATIYMSNLGVYHSISHGVLGAVLSLALLVCALEHKTGTKNTAMIYLLLFSMSFLAVFGKGYTLRAGNISTVAQVRGIIKEGPATGIFTNYIQAYITNCTYEDFQQYTREGENCLIVTNMQGVAGTTPYLFQNLSVSHFSIVDPTSYDERLLTYWECYPEKKPDVIVVDCWYGDLKEQPDSWIMQYIENEFGYSTVTDGTYVRFYRK